MSENFLFGKPINLSMLERGFAIPVKFHELFSFYLRGGMLAHGEKRTITIFFDGEACGLKAGEFYGVNLSECHHIAPFSESLNNDAKNLLIVCPNHHRIIHAAKPTFDRERKLYLYSNSYTEGLLLNEHL